MDAESTMYLHLTERPCREDWEVLLDVARGLQAAGIPHKVDGKTMVFAHGLEFPLEKICLTFLWDDEARVRAHFGHAEAARSTMPGFKYFDAMHRGRKVRCMFYGDCAGDDGEAFLWRDADVVDVDGVRLRVQSLDFYLRNVEPEEELYARVEEWVKARER